MITSLNQMVSSSKNIEIEAKKIEVFDFLGEEKPGVTNFRRHCRLNSKKKTYNSVENTTNSMGG